MADTDLFFTTRGDLESVADAIREKGGTVADLVYPDGFVTAIGNISGGGGTINNEDKTVEPTESEQSITYDTGYTGLGTVTVEAISSTYVGSGVARKGSSDLTVSGATITAPAGFYATAASASVANGSAGTPTATKGSVSNHSISVTPSVTNTTGYITGSTKTGTAVSVSASELVSGNKSITSNGNNIDVANYSTVSVSVSGGTPVLETITKSYTPTESQQTDTITAGTGYDAIEEVDVTVGAISSTYVGSGISRKSSSDLTASGATVTAPAGYYSSNASKSITSGTATAPSTISGTSATISTGTNTLTLSKTVSVTPSITTAGYISSGTAGNSAVSLTANVTTKGTATITPGTTNQTIASGTYITGTQTISGDANLVASNIKNGVPIFGVTGSYTGGGGVTGVAKGTLTVASNVNTSTNTKITDTSTIGFTPTAFLFYRSDRSATSNHVNAAFFVTLGSSYYISARTRYSSNALSTSGSTTNWTTQSSGYLYFNSNNVYFRSSSSYILAQGTWYWVAIQ